MVCVERGKEEERERREKFFYMRVPVLSWRPQQTQAGRGVLTISFSHVGCFDVAFPLKPARRPQRRGRTNESDASNPEKYRAVS